MMFFIDIIGEIPWQNSVADEFCNWIKSFQNRLIYGDNSPQEFVSILQDKLNELACNFPEYGLLNECMVSISQAPDMESYRVEVHPKEKPTSWFSSLLLRKVYGYCQLRKREEVSNE